MLVAQAPADTYFAQSLQGWEQGRFIRFHGAAQWVGWLWPYAAISYPLARLAAREPRPLSTRSRRPHKPSSCRASRCVRDAGSASSCRTSM